MWPPPAAVIVLAIVGFSVAAPLVRTSHADPLAIAAWRLALSLPIIAMLLLPGRGWRQWRTLDRRALGLCVASGVALALHFWAWNVSLGLTSVAASVVLVDCHPVIVALCSALWLGERPTRAQWAGILAALAGAMLIAAGDLRIDALASSRRAVLGDLLALAGAVAVAMYYLAGRRLRQRLDLWPYVGLVYGVALVVLVCIAGARHVPLWPQPPREMAIFAGLALGPMLLGHTGMNWALRYLPAFVVSVAVLGEPVGASLLAAALPWIHEVPPAATLAGGALVLAGIALALPRAAPAP
ncbi:MAG TPA: DMT family transporter [Gemmatimonadaceae bacterium]|nr:DMT family transporter [Gemmatimonadaceae bacterium]